MRLIRASYGTFFDGKPIVEVQWPHFDLLVLHSGRAKIVIEGREFELVAHSALLIFPNTCFSVFAKTKICRASIHHFSVRDTPYTELDSHLNALQNKYNNGMKYHFGADSWLISNIERSLTLATDIAKNKEVQHLQRHLLSMILLQLSQVPELGDGKLPKHEQAIKNLLEFIEQNPEKITSVAQMAAAVMLSVSHFRMTFQQYYNQPPLRYLHQIKMRQACRLLVESPLPIKSIAAQLGYDDVSHFYRHFAKTQGVTPLTYREEHVLGNGFY